MTPSHDIDLDDEAGADEALDLATAGFAMRVLKVICAVTTDLAPEIVRGKRPSDRASVTRKLWFYTLNNWMSAKSIGALSGFNPAHINREVQQLLTWAEANAAFEEYLERFDAFVLSIPEIVGFSEDMVTEMILELAADRVRRAAKALEEKAPPPVAPSKAPVEPIRVRFPLAASSKKKLAEHFPHVQVRPEYLRVVGESEARA